MDEKKINSEITEENAPITEGEDVGAPDAVETEQPAEAVQNEEAAQAKQLKKKKRRRVRLAIAAALLAYAAVILFRQYVYIPGKYEAPPTPVPTAAPVMTWEVAATPEPTPYVKKIPVKMYFTAREVSFPVERVGLVPYTDAEGNQVVNELGQKVYTMGTLDTEKAAAWLDIAASPGEYGNAILNGHITWKKVAGVFSLLPKMEAGEEIIVEYDDGSTMRFLVDSVNIFAFNDEPADVMAFDTGDSRMTLITCYGESWNSEMGTREQRCVVVAKPANEADIIYPYYEEDEG